MFSTAGVLLQTLYTPRIQTRHALSKMLDNEEYTVVDKCDKCEDGCSQETLGAWGRSQLCLTFHSAAFDAFLRVGLETCAQCLRQVTLDLPRMNVLVDSQRVTTLESLTSALTRCTRHSILSLKLLRRCTQSAFALVVHLLHRAFPATIYRATGSIIHLDSMCPSSLRLCQSADLLLADNVDVRFGRVVAELCLDEPLGLLVWTVQRDV